MQDLLLASKNRGKLREIREIFAGTHYHIISLMDYPDSPDVVEDGITFEENAKIKAKAIFEKYGLPVIADDSGIMLYQLDNRPGVYSARYAGENASDADNNTKLLQELSQLPAPHKGEYACCAVYYDGLQYLTAFGHLTGEIVFQARGTNGFGYDPYFVPDGYTKTMAELPMEDKNAISHRGKAFRQLQLRLQVL
jgi:XTP/dITP diphosphohydrolase